MSVKGTIKETAGYIKEETGEMMNDKKIAQEGRQLRNEGKVENGELQERAKSPRFQPWDG